jgi:uncharacterized protein (TIGR02452 family)
MIDIDYNEIRKWRVNIHEKLSDDFNNESYIYENKKINIDKLSILNCINKTIKYSYFDLKIPPINYDGKIKIINDDCLDLALSLKDCNPVLLNMANTNNPGGGYKHGAGAQEEQLFRRSCLHLCLKREYYPLQLLEGLYSPDVVVISNNESTKYSRYLEPKTISIITMAAYNNKRPDISQDYIDNLMYEKIDMIFKIAIKNSHDVIILSAFGCGAFNNDPQIIANIFKFVIEKNNYCKYFKYILFAIIDDYNSKGNYKIFNKVFN